LLLFAGEIVGFDVPDVLLDGSGDLFVEAEVPAEEPGLEFGSDAQQVVHDEHLAVAVFAGADADGGDSEGLGYLLTERRGYLFEDEAKSPCFFQQAGVFFEFLGFGLFATLSFIEALVQEGRLRHGLARGIADVMGGVLGRLFMVLGALFGLFVAGYTGVLLSVSNQPVWSDTWALGGLFLASGLSVAAATLAILARSRADAASTERKLSRADRIFIVLELLLLAAFFVTLGTLAGRLFAPRWIVLWVLVALGTFAPLLMHRAPGAGRAGAPVLAAGLVLLGGLALRIVLVFGAQM